MWGRCESAASEAPCIQVCAAVHLKRPDVDSKVFFNHHIEMLFFRLRLASFDSRGKLVCSRSTGYQLLTLEKDQVSEHS